MTPTFEMPAMHAPSFRGAMANRSAASSSDIRNPHTGKNDRIVPSQTALRLHYGLQYWLQS